MSDSTNGQKDEEALPGNWVMRYSKSKNGRVYYYNTKTQQSVWEKPSSLEEAKSVKRKSEVDKEGPQHHKPRQKLDQVRASHLLVKHKDSRRPASWKQDVITRTKEEARSIIEGFRSQIVNGEVEFEELARQESDCSSAKQGGDLGFFGRGKMQKPFEDVAFAMEVGALSDIVSTESGLHIIKRTG